MTERAFILCKGTILGPGNFPVNPEKRVVSTHIEESVNLKSHEISMVRKALANCNYNQIAASDQLGITRDALIRKMKKYDITIHKGE